VDDGSFLTSGAEPPRARVTSQSLVKAGLQVTILGSASAAIGFGIGHLVGSPA